MPSGDGRLSSGGGRRNSEAEAEGGAAEEGALNEAEVRGGPLEGAGDIPRACGK
jgi:hypothetical protein